MSGYVERSGLKVAATLADFVESEALPGTGVDAAKLWDGLAGIAATFVPQNRALLHRREDLQAKVDSWHAERAGQAIDQTAYETFLREIGYLAPEPEAFEITTANVDAEVATLAGPQLVVPSLNTRFALNAANARWGSLYDALYGTDVLDAPPPRAGGYDADRGAAVIAYAKNLLDEIVPLPSGQWADLTSIADVPRVGYRGDPTDPDAILVRHNGLHIEVVVDRSHPIGAKDPAGISDVVMEAALSTIVDLEDSVAAVDAEDKVGAYRTWLGLMKGDLAATFDKGADDDPDARP